jgi:hypothetical protein
VDTKDFTQADWSKHNADVAAFSTAKKLSADDRKKAKALLKDGIKNAGSPSELGLLLDGVLNVGGQVNNYFN